MFNMKLKKNSDVVETTITIRTKYLAKEVKILCDFNFKVALLALLSALLTSITTIRDDGATIINFLRDMKNIDFPFASFLLCFISIVAIVLSIYSFFKQFSTYNPTDFVNKIVEDQYDSEDHTAIFLIKGMFNNIPKLLVFRSESWNSYFLPYCHYENNLNEAELKNNLKQPMSELLEIEQTDFEIYDTFSQKTYVAIKKNPSQNNITKINYRFYYIKFTNQHIGRKFFNSNLQHFTWKSKYELSNDTTTQINNGDVISIIDELSLINQTQVAFQERLNNSFDVTSRYNIIWNITNECYYNCDICATNSGQSCKCETTYDEKINILLNLSTISGNIDQLDISGGDPLKCPEDRDIIKKIHQIFAFSDISVTTTGAAIEKLPVNELVETVKKCDITYDIPYTVCKQELTKYREYYYNYYNFRQLEKISSSGIALEFNVHIPILPDTINEEIINMILDDLSHLNPAEVKLIRLMPVGRMQNKTPTDYNPQKFVDLINKIKIDKKYNFNITYNCSLGNIVHNESDGTVRVCSMLKNKLGIDHNGRVYSCIWGAYIKEFSGDNYFNNPFYLGDLKTETMREILTKPSTIKLMKKLENKQPGCRVCAYIDAPKSSTDNFESNDVQQIMLTSEDPLYK